MDPAIAKALKKRQELEKELQKLDQFLEMYYELAGTNREEPDTSPPRTDLMSRLTEASGMIRPRGRPADFARIMEAILKDVGHPMQRGPLVVEIEKRGHSIPSDDKPRYVGTILWRNSDTFESVDGRGYWLKGVPVPPTHLDELI